MGFMIDHYSTANNNCGKWRKWLSAVAKVPPASWHIAAIQMSFSSGIEHEALHFQDSSSILFNSTFKN